jgi:hypothetical protein
MVSSAPQWAAIGITEPARLLLAADVRFCLTIWK